jgi:hypothetical protein
MYGDASVMAIAPQNFLFFWLLSWYDPAADNRAGKNIQRNPSSGGHSQPPLGTSLGCIVLN